MNTDVIQARDKLVIVISLILKYKKLIKLVDFY